MVANLRTRLAHRVGVFGACGYHHMRVRTRFRAWETQSINEMCARLLEKVGVTGHDGMASAPLTDLRPIGEVVHEITRCTLFRTRTVTVEGSMGSENCVGILCLARLAVRFRAVSSQIKPHSTHSFITKGASVCL